MSSVPIRSIPGDATLVWLASERAMPLFRPLDRPRAFAPLVALLCILPPVIASFGERMTPTDAAWGLHALALNGEPLPPEATVAADQVVSRSEVRPAALWPTALAFRVLDPAKPVTTALPSLIGGAALIVLLRPLARAAGGPRLALWTVLIAAFHPGLIPLLSDPVPVTVALASAVIVFRGHLSLAGPPRKSVPAFFGIAVAVAVGWWIVGPVAAVVPAIVVADALLAALTVDRSRPAARPIGPTFAVTVARIVAAAAGVFAGLALDLADPLSRLSPSVLAAVAPPGFGVEAVDGAAAVLGPLWGLALLGVARLVRVLRSRASAKTNRPLPRLILPWAALAVALYGWVGRSDGFAPEQRYAAAMLVLPAILAAAYGIDEVARRTVVGGWGAAAVIVPLLVEIPSLAGRRGGDGPGVWIVSATGAVAALWLLLKLRNDRAGSVGLRRGVLMAVLLAGVGLNAAEGLFAAVRREGDLGYARLRNQVAAAPAPKAVVLLSDGVPPPSLLFAAATAAPDAAFEIAPTWEEIDAGHARRFGPSRPPTLVFAWGGRDAAGAVLAQELKPFGEPILFAGRELLLYVRKDGDADGDSEENRLDPRLGRN